MDDIKRIRIQIDEIDTELFKLLDKRFSLVEKIGTIKKGNNIEVEQLGREKIINEKINNDCIYNDYIKNVYQLIYKESKKIQK